MAHFFISPKSNEYPLLNPNYVKLQQLILYAQYNSMLAHLLRDKYQTIISLTPYYAGQNKIAERTNMGPNEPTDQHPQERKKRKRRLCPFVRSPSKDCYFLDMNSNKISMALYYCQNHYTHCTIYKRIKTKKREKPGAGGKK